MVAAETADKSVMYLTRHSTARPTAGILARRSSPWSAQLELDFFAEPRRPLVDDPVAGIVAAGDSTLDNERGKPARANPLR